MGPQQVTEDRRSDREAPSRRTGEEAGSSFNGTEKIGVLGRGRDPVTEASGVDPKGGKVLSHRVYAAVGCQHEPARIQHGLVACWWKMMNPNLVRETKIRLNLGGSRSLGGVCMPGIDEDGCGEILTV